MGPPVSVFSGDGGEVSCKLSGLLDGSPVLGEGANVSIGEGCVVVLPLEGLGVIPAVGAGVVLDGSFVILGGTGTTAEF